MDAPSAPLRALRRRARLVLPVAVFALVYFSVLVYPVLRILGLCFPDWQPRTPELLLIMVGPLAGRLLCEWLPGGATRAVSAAVMTWLGVCFVAFCLVLPWELLRFALSLPPQASGWTLLAAVALLTAAGFVNAQRVRIRRVDVSAPAPVRGLRLAQISDVHVGSRSGRFLRRVVARVNETPADLVVITGDLVDFRDIGETELAPLGRLRAPAYFIIGNHERYVDCEAICARLRALGIRVLRNESRLLEPGIQLVGIDDAEPKTQIGRVLPGIAAEPERFRILLYHRPDGIQQAADWGAHLMLCGHTHNGQIVPFNYLVRRIFPRICGLYRIGAMQLYVSPGTGTWGPVLRLGSRSEITLLHLDG